MKSWVDDITAHVKYWSRLLKPLGRDWWPRYVYHFTDVQNAAGIIESGCIYSRVEVDRRKLMINDNASLAVIAQTDPVHKRFARMYFRPRTPTQYCNEGIRPVGKRYRPDPRHPPAHCPVPVFFCFDAIKVLCRDDTEFSDGNMGSSHARHAGTREWFKQIPFRFVFHYGSIQGNSDITFHQNAEVLVPTALQLEPDITMIVCRSVAERQMLLHLLPRNQQEKWDPMIRLGYDGLFERTWTFVESLTIIDDRVYFRFNPNTSPADTYRVRSEYYEQGELRDEREEMITDLSHTYSFRLPGATFGEVRLYIEGCIAFADDVSFVEIPF